MAGSESITVPSDTDDPVLVKPEARSVYALVQLWSKREPRRVGEVALLDTDVSSVWSYGRDGGEDAKPGRTRVRFGQQTPARTVFGGRLLGPIGYVPPVEFETAYYRQLESAAMGVGLT